MHPDKCKLAGTEFIRFEENSGPNKHKKKLKISFQEREEIIDYTLYKKYLNQFNEQQMRPKNTILKSILLNRP